MLNKWDQRFIDLAMHIADWSKDPSTKVGAVVVDPSTRRVVSTGFNGFPVGVEDTADRLENREIKYEMVVHAEQNALVFCGAPISRLHAIRYPTASVCAMRSSHYPSKNSARGLPKALT